MDHDGAVEPLIQDRADAGGGDVRPRHDGDSSVAVIGGGVAGLVAARVLGQAGANVTVFEAGPRCGGQVRTVDFRGCRVDVGAEALHLAGPHVGALIEELGLGDELIRSTAGSAWIWTERGLRRLPAGVGPAGPTRLTPMIGSGILSVVGLARAALEPLVPAGPLVDDVGVGEFLARRFGRQVSERLVDPVLGSLHAGSIDRLSLQAATPYVAAQASRSRSLLLAQRHRRGAGAPSFVTFSDGLVALVDALVATPGLHLRLASGVDAVTADDGRYSVQLANGERHLVDAVVLAVPARVAASILQPIAPSASAVLSTFRAASVATVLAAYPRNVVDSTPALGSTGLLVPSTAGRLLKAATFLSSKWPHLREADRFLVRMSAGRVGSEEVAGLSDAELVGQLHADLAAATGLVARPDDVHVERWPATLARLEVGHLGRMAEIHRQLAGHDRIVLAGAPYDGLGLAACLAAGRRAAEHVLGSVATQELRP